MTAEQAGAGSWDRDPLAELLDRPARHTFILDPAAEPPRPAAGPTSWPVVDVGELADRRTREAGFLDDDGRLR